MTRTPEEYVDIASHPENYSRDAVKDALEFWTRLNRAVKASTIPMPMTMKVGSNDNRGRMAT